MCGFLTHGFWWEENEDYVVVADWEINWHTGIKEYHKDLIPANAKRWGFNPTDGEPVTNEDTPLPEKVKEKIHLLQEMYFPNKEAIAEWMLKNYGKQGDEKEWDLDLPIMLDDEGRGLFSDKYYQRAIENYQMAIERCRREIERYQRATIKDYQVEVEIKRYQVAIKDYQVEIERYQQVLEYSSGELDKMDIEKFVAYFLQHPNSFWADRTEERKVEYRQFVRV